MDRRRLPPLASLLILGLSLARIASASGPHGVPSPVDWDLPPMVALVGENGAGVADPLGEFTATIRDLAGTPIAGALVTIDFGNCADVRLCADPLDPGATVQCGGRSVSKLSDVNGQVRLRLVGCTSAPPGGSGTTGPCARIYADGVLGAQVPVAIYDLTGCDGLGPADISAWLDAFFSGLFPARCDFDGTQDLGANDLSLLISALFGNGSVANCGAGGTCTP